MKNSAVVNITWLKASVLGCLWASSEIVLGSFLHNLHIPLSSIFLTSIGLILLISISYGWKDKGLIWRAGLICAIMKSVSPSAVIFGPMIAIFSEALLLEISVRFIGRNIVGYISGSLLAMSWNLLQKIVNYLIFYGFSMIDLYTSLVQFSEKELGFHFSTLWIPIIVLWFFYIAFGLFSAFAGIYLGKTTQHSALPMLSFQPGRIHQIRTVSQCPAARQTIVWLLLNFSGMILVLSLMNFSAIQYWLFCGTTIIAIWAFRYKNALKPLLKPGFWVLFLLIAMLSGLLLAGMQSRKMNISDGLLAGFEMNFRAAVMIVGFSVIGRELANPRIRILFTRTIFRQLPQSLEIAFAAMPSVIENFPPIRLLFTKPISAIRYIVAQSEFWLQKVILSNKKDQKLVIISGDIGSGKTRMATKIAALMKSQGIKVSGILAPAVVSNKARTGYRILNIKTMEEKQLSITSGSAGMARVGKYYFLPEAIAFGKKALLIENNLDSQLVFIDEIGAWELQGQGWATSLNQLIIEGGMPLIICVRNIFTGLVTCHWNFPETLILEVGKCTAEEAVAKITRFTGVQAVNCSYELADRC
jgi:nucleoside-triphosphatase THEP1